MFVKDFIHLRMYSEYSIYQSILSIREIIKAAKADNFVALAITDINNLFGTIKFYKECIKEGIKPIIGCDIYIKNKINRDKPYRLLLLVKNKLGYLNLSKLISRASIYNKYKDRLEFDLNWFKSNLNNGLIALSGAQLGNIGNALLENKINLAKLYANYLSKCFTNRFYIELQRYDIKKNKNYNEKAIHLANILKLPIVATHPIVFMNKSDFKAHEVRVCISNNTTLEDKKRDKIFSKNQFFFSKKKMIELFFDLPSAIKNTVEISKQCNLILDLEKIKLPFLKLKNFNNNKFLIKLAKKGLKKILNLKKNENILNKTYLIYKKRLMYECKTIISMGFSDYFLIVYDFINWSKNNDIPVGPGRGSSAGSLVSYCLNITNIDPIKYNLLFERFLNKERISMPDFDIDFCQNKRNRVINYIKKKYGLNSIFQIITFGTMATKAAVRDVGRILNFNYNFVDKISKLIPFKYNNINNITTIIKENFILKERYRKEIDVKNLIDLASKMEGLIRNLSIHSGGIIISPNKIFNFCPIYTQNNIIITEYYKDDIESMGLLKFDFLGLTTLTILSNCIKILKNNNKIYKNWSFNKISLNDKLCFDNLKTANTIAIFQLESQGMRNMILEAKPDCFENIIALISLHRPGPINLLHNFCLRKLGKEKINYPDYRLKDLLKETYGIIIYQEQVMQIAQIISNYSLAQADILRRAMAKKFPEEMSNQRKIFCKGAKINGLTEIRANKIFDLMDKFSGYGFNKSHATAYALLSYQTIWLKTYYLTEFMCSNMSYSSNDVDKLFILINDSKKNNIFILPININKSGYQFLCFNKKFNKIRYGLGAIKGIGVTAIKTIIKLRHKNSFKNLTDFCERINKNIINYRMIEILICSGAFDCIDLNRANLINNLFLIIKLSDSKKLNLKQEKLFNQNEIDKIYYKTKIFFWNFKTKLIEEKFSIGFSLLNNIYNIYNKKFKNILNKKFNNNNNNINITKNKILTGIIYDIQERSFMNNKIIIITLNNNNEKFEVKINFELFMKNTKILKKYNFLLIIGESKFNNYNNKLYIIANKLMDIKKSIKFLENF